MEQELAQYHNILLILFSDLKLQNGQSREQEKVLTLRKITLKFTEGVFL